jgi:hypothetical protein
MFMAVVKIMVVAVIKVIVVEASYLQQYWYFKNY